MRITKVPAAQVFPAIPSFFDVDRARASRIRHRACCVIAANHALLLSGFRRQHFFKREAVFFVALVYSGCSAVDTRVHAASRSHLTLEGNMAKKAKKAKKAKSAVKKTAKKTRKVAKKKK
ncbi:MAG TPA: hypothetical protein VMM15_29800 [Bradyrhizobium sp.]|nr:hypothetical protein [Bradyrhizobium sp.]